MLEFLEDLDAIEAEVSQEAALIVDTQNDLCDAFAQIAADGGVSRDVATNIAKYVPSMESVHINSFTVYPSKTNANVAVEGFWSGITDAIGAIFEAIFKLMFAVLRLFVKPFEWLFGHSSGGDSSSGGGGGGAHGAAVSSLDSVKDGDKDKATEELAKDKEKAKEVAQAIAEKSKFNSWDLLVGKHVNGAHFEALNGHVEKLYRIMADGFTSFTDAFDKLESGNAFPAKMKALNDAADGDTRAVFAVVADVAKSHSAILEHRVDEPKDYKGVDNLCKTLKEAIKDAENTDIEVSILRKSVMLRMASASSELKKHTDALDFSKSDEALMKTLDKHSDAFEKFKKVIDGYDQAKMESMGLTADEIREVQASIKAFTGYIGLLNRLVSTILHVSVKGKRSVFKNVKEYTDITAASFAAAKAQANSED